MGKLIERNIKYRAYDKRLERWVESKKGQLGTFFNKIDCGQLNNLCLSTGCYDNHHHEIFENDIVEYNEDKSMGIITFGDFNYIGITSEKYDAGVGFSIVSIGKNPNTAIDEMPFTQYVSHKFTIIAQKIN